MAKKYLIMGNGNSPYLHELAENLKKFGKDIQVDLLTNTKLLKSPPYVDRVYSLTFFFALLNLLKLLKKGGNNSSDSSTINDKTSSLSRMQRYSLKVKIIMTKILLTFVPNRAGEYDVIQIHSISAPHYYLPLLNQLKKMSREVNLIFWGSDINQIQSYAKEPMRHLIAGADKVYCYVPAQKEQMKQLLQGQSLPQIHYIRFGLSSLEVIKTDSSTSRKERIKRLGLNISDNTKMVTLGHYGSPIHQHLKVIQALAEHDYPDTLFLLPMTYGASSVYKEQVISALEQSGLNYHIFSEFMTYEQIAALRLITDIFINCLETDGLSGAMLEHLYAGSVLITGSWLNYTVLKEGNVNFKEIDSIEEVPLLLQKVLNAMEKEKKTVEYNPPKIWELASWEGRINDWLEM